MSSTTRLIALALCAALSACATIDKDVEIAHAGAQAERERTEQARLDTLKTLANGTGEASRVAGIMAMTMGQRYPPQQQAAPPRSSLDVGLDFLAKFLGFGVQAYGINKSADVSIRSSDNARKAQIGAYEAIGSIAGMIQAPGDTTTTTTANTISGAGVIGAGSYTATDRHDMTTTTTTDSHDATATPTVVTQPSPVVVRPDVVQPIIWSPVP